MLPSNIESEVKEILENKGKAGWLRMGECEKAYLKLKSRENQGTVHVRFYRWTKEIEQKKVRGFQIVKFLSNISHIGLATADPSVLDSMIAKNEQLAAKALSFHDAIVFQYLRELKEIRRIDASDSSLEAMHRIRGLIAELSGFLPSKSMQKLKLLFREKWKSFVSRWNKEVVGVRPPLTGAPEVSFMISAISQSLHSFRDKSQAGKQREQARGG
jgi:hypothetical protein